MSDFHCDHLEEHRLDNGLRVQLHSDRRLPLVALNLWYHVGSKNERPGWTGFSHLFEHLLFQGSKNVDTNGHFRYIQQVGGTANGSTWYDRTNYYETLPSHHLERGLWLESDRMGTFLDAVTQQKLDTQREVVINERRQRMDNQPYGRALERLNEMLFPEGHSYRWPVIGSVADIEGADLDMVRHFFRTYYVPNNAVLTLAGDFEPDDALRRIEKFFGWIPRGDDVVQPEIEMPVLEQARHDVQTDHVHLPRLYMGAHCRPFATDEWYAADLLTSLLAWGKASPMYQDLVVRRRLAQDVSAFVMPTEAASTTLLIATAMPDVDLDELEAAIDGHLRDAGDRPPDEEALERTRRITLAQHFSRLQTLSDRADRLSMFATFRGDPTLVWRESERWRNIGPEDLRRFAAERLAPERRATLRVVPEATTARADA
ncbi:MAG: pitrilysin family protein [Acidobacteriota bacterium]